MTQPYRLQSFYWPTWLSLSMRNMALFLQSNSFCASGSFLTWMACKMVKSLAVQHCSPALQPTWSPHAGAGVTPASKWELEYISDPGASIHIFLSHPFYSADPYYSIPSIIVTVSITLGCLPPSTTCRVQSSHGKMLNTVCHRSLSWFSFGGAILCWAGKFMCIPLLYW